MSVFDTVNMSLNSSFEFDDAFEFEMDSDEDELDEKCIDILSSLLPYSQQSSVVKTENAVQLLPRTLEELAFREGSLGDFAPSSSLYNLDFVRQLQEEEEETNLRTYDTTSAEPESEIQRMSTSSPGGLEPVTSPTPGVRHRNPPDVTTKPPIDTVRFSMNNLKESSEWDLDAVLEELDALTNQLSSDAGDSILLGIPTLPASTSSDKLKRERASERLPPAYSGPSSSSSQIQHVQEVSQHQQRVTVEVLPPRSQTQQIHSNLSNPIKQTRLPVYAASVCSSPDADSAYGDSSSTESHRFNGSNMSSGDSCRDSLHTPSPTQVSPQNNLTAEEIKAQKIRDALEKMKEAKVTRIFVKFFVDDGGAPLQMLIDERWTVAQTMRQLADKHNMTLYEDHCIVEEYPDLYIKRIYEDHELIVENIQLWQQDSSNKLWFVRRSDKYPFIDRPEHYLVTERTADMEVPEGDNWSREVKHTFVRDFFDRDNVVPPELEGFLLLKSDGKKSWKKHYFVLRPSGLYYAPKGKKSSKDLQCLMNLHSNQVYSGFDWKKKYKAPTEFCFCIKLTALQIKRSSYVKYICCEDEATFRKWMVALRIAKNGRDLYTNWCAAVEQRREALERVAPLRVDIPRGDSRMSGIGRSVASSQADLSVHHQQTHKQPSTSSHSPATVSRISHNSHSSHATTDRCSSAALSTALYEVEDVTGTIKRAPMNVVRRAPSHSSGSGPSIGGGAEEEDSDEETFPAPPHVSVSRIQTTPTQYQEPQLSTPTSLKSPVPPPKPQFPPPSVERPQPPARQTLPLNLTPQTPQMAQHMTPQHWSPQGTPQGKKAPPPPPKRSEVTRVTTVPSPVPPPSTGHISELEAALGRRRQQIGGL